MSCGAAHNLGVELGVTALATRWFDLGASYTFLDLRLRDYTTSVLDFTGTPVEVDFSGRSIPGVPGHRITGDAQLRPLDRLGPLRRRDPVRRVENLFVERYVANVRANEIFGRFYEARPPAWVSVGISVAGWGPARDTDP